MTMIIQRFRATLLPIALLATLCCPICEADDIEWANLPDWTIIGEGTVKGLKPLFTQPESSGGKPLIPPHQRPDLSPATEVAVTGVNQFGFDLFQKLRKSPTAEANDLVSPLSISTAFAMTYAGAQGETARQMEQTFGFDPTAQGNTHSGLGDLLQDLNTERDGRELRVVNRLFGNQQTAFKEGFLTTNRESYGAPLERLDFVGAANASREHINRWVEDQTNDRIRNLLPGGSVTKDTRLVLTNALYFNGDWKHAFQESATRNESFYLADQTEQTVSMMRQRNSFRYGEFDGYKMLEIPYAGDDLSMVIALPEEIDGLADFEQSYNAEQFAKDLSDLRPNEVNVSLPKFTFETSHQLKGPLKDPGLTDPFSGAANFSGISDVPLVIDGVYHKTFIDVSESGTEAAAATAISIGTTSAYIPNEPPKVFQADHSFLFAIRDTHTGALLFLGRMGDPESAIALAAGSLPAVPEPGSLLLILSCVGLVAGGRLRGERKQ